MQPKLYNGVRLLGNGPSIKNIEKIDAGAMPMILAMARTGLQVDLDHFAKMEVELVRDMDQITEDVHTITGKYINLDSGDQVSELLFKTLGLKQARFKLTNSGDRESVEDEVLKAIQHDHPVVPKVMDYKELSKLLGTYVRPMPKLARKVSSGVFRMFPNLSTTRVPSGRLACKQPNLLAMPTRTARGRDIRKGFDTAEGWVYVSVDESQIEVRICAHSSGDPGLIKVYENEEDVYSDYATTAFHLPDKRYRDAAGWHYPGVDRMLHRYPAKTCFLAAIYDVTAGGLLEQMPVGQGWTEAKCQDILNSFYFKYSGVLEDRKRHHKMARRLGYVYDMWGRVLHVAAVRSIHTWVVSSALRECGNFPYQSGAQGTIKLTMAAVMDDLEQMNMLEVVHPLLQVHDELLFECREDVADDLIDLVKMRFETCAPLKVPIVAGGAKALSWGALDK